MGGRRKKRELRRIYRHRDSMHWLKPTFLPELFELGYILLRKCISPRHQSLMAPSGLSAYPTPKFVGCVFIPRCAPLEKSVDTRERCLPLPPHAWNGHGEYKRRARGWFAMFCRGSTTGSITTTSGGKRDGASDDLSVIPWITGPVSSTIFRVKLRQHPRDNFRVTGKPNRERKGTEWDEKREARRNGASQIGIGIHR